EPGPPATARASGPPAVRTGPAILAQRARSRTLWMPARRPADAAPAGAVRSAPCGRRCPPPSLLGTGDGFSAGAWRRERRKPEPARRTPWQPASDGQALAALGAAGVDDGAAAARLHA